MNKEILDALLEIVKQGGQYSLWGIFLYWIMIILTIAVKGGVVCLVISMVLNFSRFWISSYFNKAKESYPIISSQASDKILEAFTKIIETMDLKLKDIKKTSEDSQKKTS